MSKVCCLEPGTYIRSAARARVRSVVLLVLLGPAWPMGWSTCTLLASCGAALLLLASRPASGANSTAPTEVGRYAVAIQARS